MNPLKVPYNGQVYEFVGYDYGSSATHYLTTEGTLVQAKVTVSTGTAWFRLVPVRHTFGGIVFEETDTRQVQCGEWYMDKGWTSAILSRCSSFQHYIILKPVEVIDAEDNQG